LSLQIPNIPFRHLQMPSKKKPARRFPKRQLKIRISPLKTICPSTANFLPTAIPYRRAKLKAIPKKACKNGIASVQRNSGSDVENLEDKAGVHVKGAKYETYKDKRGEFRFRLKATNGQIIAVGEGYKALANCMNAIKSIKTNAKSAEVVDETKAEKADAKKPASKKPSGKAKKTACTGCGCKSKK